MNVIQLIKNYWIDHKINKVLLKINKHLNEQQFRSKSFVKEINNFQYRRSVISDDQIKTMKDKYTANYIYLSTGNVMFFDAETKLIFDQAVSRLLVSSMYGQMNLQFAAIREEFMAAYYLMEENRLEVNAKIKYHESILANSFIHIGQLRNNYMTNSNCLYLLETYKSAYEFFVQNEADIVDETVKEFMGIYKNLKNHIKEWNKAYIESELVEHNSLFNNIDGKSLDDQQRVAVITDEDNNLVLAGAGSGKTLTISGKVKYLVEKKGIHPEDILLISFTRMAANEMDERISERLGLGVDVKTFHKLGLEIIAKESQSKPNIFDAMSKVLEDYMKKEIYEDGFQIRNIIEFFAYFITVPKDFSDFENLGEYHEFHKNIDFETLKGKMSKSQYAQKASQRLSKDLQTLNGETVKSFEETLIANFLFLNSVNYEYEMSYPHNTSEENYRQYKPDFYLPDYDLYIEHFGINEKMRAPWLDGMEEEKYLTSMQWKRELHKQYGTKLIESFSYYNKKGVLLEELQKNLLVHQVTFREPDFQEIFSTVYDRNQDKYFKEFIKLIGSFLGLFKSNRYNEAYFDQLIVENRKRPNIPFLKQRTELFMKLVKPIYLHYEAQLKKEKAIDFNDMINMATEIVHSGNAQFGYKYIIIDEFQDISKSRFNLIHAIKQKTNAKIMCVGDDWQSIYRFAGSDIQLFTKFGEHFGFFEMMKIEKTYRNSQELIDIAGKFVMSNPNQLKKNLKSHKHKEGPLQVMGYKKDSVAALKKAIEEIVTQSGESAEIMLLGRNNFDLNFLDGNEEFVPKYEKESELMMVYYQKYSKLKMYFLTTHRSKGLEGENVIVINGKNSMVGFPNKISDDPILSWVLTNQDTFDFAEERRLFYVALTRTKNKCYILAPEQNMSLFVKELIEKCKVPYKMVSKEETMVQNPNCPRCKKGFLLKRAGKDGNAFLGCSNYPGCDYSLRHIEILNKQKKCGTCSGYMIVRKGPRGKFYGCTNYPNCNNTEKIMN
jgi:DNA helicase-4